LILVALAGSVCAEELVLAASKDTFGRSNKRNRNNGASEQLYIAHASNVRTLIAFDLSSITNEITHAEFRFRLHNTLPDKISMVVAPMVNTPNNVKWGEGRGALGAQGQNSLPGEACYAFSLYREVPWESGSGTPLANLGDPNLWKSPVAALNGLRWEENKWIRILIENPSMLENIRNSESPVITFGLWGKAGKGLYSISSKDSRWTPALHLQLKELEGK